MFGLVNKIMHTVGFGYIEDAHGGTLGQYQEYDIQQGRAARVTRKAVNRLTDAMMADDLLLGNCIKEAQRLGHKIL
jgi:hypothetical protein